jgi:hypothetical protein
VLPANWDRRLDFERNVVPAIREEDGRQRVENAHDALDGRALHRSGAVVHVSAWPYGC